MKLFNNFFIDQWLVPTFIIFLFIGSLFAIVIGTGLILRSAAMFRFFGVMNRWVSTRKILKPVEIPRNTDAAMHRQRRTIGSMFILGAGFSFVLLIKEFDVAAIVLVFQRSMAPTAVEIAARTAKWVLLVGDVLAIAVGIAMIAVPEALAKLEARSNEWYSVRRHDRNFDQMHMHVDGWVETYPRAIGWSIVLLSVFVVVNLGAVILSHA